jgi:hypothetical protein
MSFQKIVISSPESLNESLIKVSEGSVVAIVDPNVDINCSQYQERMINQSFVQDDKIGFILTDLVVKTDSFEYIKYLNSKELYSVPLFLRKPKTDINLKEGDVKVQIMEHMILNGYSFEHFAEPVFCIKKV